MYIIFIVGGRVFFFVFFLEGFIWLWVSLCLQIFFSSYFYCKIIFLGSKAEKTAAPGEKEEKS